MKADRFFTMVQRINALILLVLGIGGLGLMGFGLLDLVGWSFDEKPSPKVDVGPKAPEGMELEFGCLGRVPGQRVFVLRAEAEYRGIGSSGGTSSVHNLLFVDLDSGKSHWLLNGFRGLVLWTSLASETTQYVGRGDDRVESDPPAILYHVIDRDTNGDGTISSADDGVLAISATDGSGYTAVADGVSRVRHYLREEDTGWIFFETRKGIRLAKLDLARRHVDRITEIAKAPR